MVAEKRSFSQAEQAELQRKFGARVNFNYNERILYDHDVGALPSLIKPLVGDTTPAGIVQPENEEELIWLFKWARNKKVPLTPRASASSGYGGVLPVLGGLVIDLSRFNKIIAHDEKSQTVTVQGGVVWKDLEYYLSFYGLAPRMVPTSAPASTVGGWVAQEGSGIGSYKYGWFKENVVSVRAVLANGEVRTFTGKDLDLIFGTMGTIGVITEVTLKVKHLKDTHVIAANFQSAKDLQNFILDLGKSGLDIWHVGFINPTAAELKNQLPPKIHHGHEEKGPVLPKGFITIVAFEDSNIAGKIESLAAKNGGEILPAEITKHEWEQRYNPMKVKRIGPSLVPAEVVIPKNRLSEVFNEFERLISLPLVVEGTVVGDSEIVLLGFIPHDERKFSFNFAYSLSLTVLKTAKKFGGRSYAAGLYLANEAPAVYGERLQKIKELKAKVDPDGLFNPLKLEGKGIINTVMSLANTFEGVARWFGNKAKPDLGEKFAAKNGIPGNVAWYAYACAQCGYCRNVCTLYDGRGWESASPRGKWSFIRKVIEGKAKFDQKMVDTFLLCTTCEKCDFVCQLDLPIEPSWGVLRGDLVMEKGYMTFPAFEMMAASLQKDINIWAGFREDRDKWVPDDLKGKIKDQAEIAYFAGCTASYVENDIAIASARLLDAAGIEFTYLGKDEACCGIPMLVSGRWDVFQEIVKHNITEAKKRGVKTVVTSCPACWLSWHDLYPEWAKKLGLEYDIEAKHYSQVLEEKIKSGELKFTHEVNARVTFHDSCHIGRAGGVYEPPRELIKAVPGVEFVEMEHNRENALCCGSVLTRIGESHPTSDKLGGKRVNEAVKVNADMLIALCPCCQFQLRVAADKNNIDMPVVDLAAFAAKGLGIELPNPTPYALELWAVFEKMIALMTPEGFAQVMKALFPQMFKAMPGYMVAMMKVMRAIPGGLSLMKPMMPKMMPMLMPMVMPKVLPDMLREVEKRIPMPDYMKRQMPNLMPVVMDRLMPKMLPDVAKLVTDDMISYIKTSL
ncbi:hypothetical protein ciss_16510 [Carboxydothermus islandicus]|uniref:FAD-binding PCMH-type domain-containing protein n=1 Tax=Carboxydothermus islandicus TaxID=661089 RepID=A0A1L8D3H2_9THEO|nr:FAD-binding and (Fe-S)-binding domain-containing protein [Carboxydothermus islandicus]GAV25718.1 hypothetical protein ciss_16510 [Carboxydothermus islandicus]